MLREILENYLVNVSPRMESKENDELAKRVLNSINEEIEVDAELGYNS